MFYFHILAFSTPYGLQSFSMGGGLINPLLKLLVACVFYLYSNQQY
jgi:hypothetical protein